MVTVEIYDITKNPAERMWDNKHGHGDFIDWYNSLRDIAKEGGWGFHIMEDSEECFVFRTDRRRYVCRWGADHDQ